MMGVLMDSFRDEMTTTYTCHGSGFGRSGLDVHWIVVVALMIVLFAEGGEAYSQERSGTSNTTVSVVLVDNASITWMRKTNGVKWPWPRETYSYIVSFCKRGGARAVIFNILFTDSSSYGERDDVALSSSFNQGIPVIVACHCPSSKLPIDQHNNEMPSFERPVGLYLSELKRRVLNQDLIESSIVSNASAVGVVYRSDSFSEMSFLFARDKEIYWPTLGLSGYLAAEGVAGKRADQISVHSGKIHIFDCEYSFDELKRSIVHYEDKSGARSYTAASLLYSELAIRSGKSAILSPTVFTNSYVIVGLSADGCGDFVRMNNGRLVLGSKIHAAVIRSLVDQSARPRP